MVYPVLDLAKQQSYIHIKDTESFGNHTLFSIPFRNRTAAIELFINLTIAFRKSENDAYQHGFEEGYDSGFDAGSDELDGEGGEYVF